MLRRDSVQDDLKLERDMGIGGLEAAADSEGIRCGIQVVGGGDGGERGKQGRRSTDRVQLCPGVHSEHSLMDTRIGPIEHSQMDPTEGSRCTKHTTGCALAHISKLSRVLRCGKSENLGRGQIVHCTTLRQQNAEDEEETQRKQEEQGNWNEEATEKRWEKPNKTQERG